jgi:hypothetical protein
MSGLGEGKLLASSASEHKNPAEPGRKLGGAYMPIFLTDVVLFSSVVVLATGIVIAVAMLRWERQHFCSLTELPATGVRMSIMRYLDDFDVDPETNQVLRVALEKTRMSLGLVDDLADGIIAKQIVELAKAGERNLDLLCEGTLNKLREHLFGD